MPSLIVTSGVLTGQIFSFLEAAVIGRGQFSDVRLNDPTVSRRHALIRTIGETYELTDQESANGTRWRGQRIKQPVLIADGDEIEFGEIKTTFRVATNQHPSLRSAVPEVRATVSGRVEATAPSTPDGGVNALPAAAPGLRELLARLKLFCDIGALARREQPLREQLTQALDSLLATFPQAQRAAIYTNIAATEHLSLIVRKDRDGKIPPPKVTEDFLREAIRQENGIAIFENATRDAMAARLHAESLPAAMLGLPLRVGSDVLGALYLDGESHSSWRSADQELFLGVAGQLALLIATQRGRSPERAIEAHDLALARRIQQRFLPQSSPAINGYRIADSYAAARVIGGDYFDFIQYRDGRTGIVIADVSGKSVSGALYMARLSVQVRALGRHTSGPQELLSQLNQKLYQELEPGMFVTMLAAALEPEPGVLQFSCAGHPAPMLRDANGTVSELAKPGALPLGAMNDTQFAEHSATLAPGSCVLFYTDGLDEAHNEKNELFGKARIVKTFGKSRDAQDALDSLLADLARFTNGEAQSDDLTLIALSRNR